MTKSLIKLVDSYPSHTIKYNSFYSNSAPLQFYSDKIQYIFISTQKKHDCTRARFPSGMDAVSYL